MSPHETWGAELEFWVFESVTDKSDDPFDFVDNNGQRWRPTDLWEKLKGEHHEDAQGSDIFLDAGLNHCEIGIKPISVAGEADLMKICDRLHQAVAHLHEMLDDSNHVALFGGKNPLRESSMKQPEKPIPFNEKSVNTAYLEAIKNEGGINLANGEWMTEYSSLQLHFETGFFDDETFKLLKWLSIFAPPITCAHMNSPRLKEAWWGSGCALRQPHFFSYESKEEYLEMLSKMPQLLDYEDGIFTPRNAPPEEPLDALHVACLSHFVKYRPQFGTIEFRPLDAPTHSAEFPAILRDLRGIIHKIQRSSEAELQQFALSEGEWWQWILSGTNNAGRKWIANFLR